MPAKFDACVASGGKVRTKSLPGGSYIHICIPRGGGSSISGEVKKKQSGWKDDLKGEMHKSGK